MGSIQEPSSQMQLSKNHLGVCRVPKISNASIAEADRLLQKNHDKIHMFWREANGHNHTAHNLLTKLALGATPEELQQAYEDDARDQARVRPTVDREVVESLYDEDTFHSKLGQGDHYSDYLAFFEDEIERIGCEETINKYCFSHTGNAEAMFARLFEGAFHSLIHLGLGIEFQLPGIIAEGLAQTATDTALGMESFFHDCEKIVARTSPPLPNRPLAELLHALHDSEFTRRGALWEDVGVTKITTGILGRARYPMLSLASQFRVEPGTLEQRCTEMISAAAYMAGAGQRSGRPRKIDFFLMHDVTSSILLTVLARQEFIPLADRMRLVEFKGRMDLVWYAACGAPKLHVATIDKYEAGASAGWGWTELFTAVNSMHDDGHVAKFVRALKHGQDVESTAPMDVLPVKGDAWLNLAKMAYDTNLGLPGDKKWIFFTGFDEPWENVPSDE